ncbi:diguanylate cyclase/phosphodiesterase [Neobacillus bataviensis LMG 21833]|uniref:Diguanylate cyclase/phosphodiesterase n=1 Tax=Neobacillus bataviensis LMG 21833 TaxID=1117379 RepID=K6D9Z1_9BACI|nr:EAL domain-containing protein [Neobacillus bataviensis]EKN69357.1 diguanylate cyclase/phosphodiesterase [Neobacillus bataviensis LMG 21833]
MSIKKKIPLIFSLLVFLILLTNNAFHYIRSKNQLLEYNEVVIKMIVKEVSFQVKNTKSSSLYVEDILGRDLRTASLAIKDALPASYQDITNEQLVALAKETGVSHITLLAKTNDDIVGVRSSDPQEIGMSTKGWGYWYDAYQQLFSLKPVSVGKGITLPHYWSGPIEVASSNPKHIDKWGYYYDGSTNYMINPYFRDKITDYEKRFGPWKVIQDFTKVDGILELTVFNPKNFGKKEEVVHLNGNKYIRISAQPIWYGKYNYQNYTTDANLVKKAITTKKNQSYKDTMNGKMIMKTFVPIFSKNDQPFVIGLVYNYGLIQAELVHELKVHILLSIAIMLIVLIVSFLFSRSITQPIGYIVEHVNEIAQGNFGKKLKLKRKDELGLLTENVNAMSNHLRSYVEDLNQSKELIEYQAYHDPLTGLLNRRYFQEKLRQIIDRANKTGETVSVIFIDLDRFKQVNDSFGHNKGDEILKIVSGRIKDCLPADDNTIITRQGGDEFIILLKNYNLDKTKAAAETIVNHLKKPYSLNGKEIYLSASCGISIYPDHTKNMDTLIIYSDLAMYAAKKTGGNKVTIYSEKLSQSSIERPRLEAHLRKAIENEKIEVFYQPKINLKSGTIFGAEALVRWTDAEFGFVPPDVFIPIAEDTGLIQPLWELVMKLACSQVSKWNAARPQPLSISVNFSARQFQEPVLMLQKVKEILAESQLLPKNLEIEITESILLSNSSEIVQALESLKDIGIAVSIDDFGTGYSSLSYLKDLPINTLKIDKSFIQNINENHENAEIPEAIINLARSLHLDVIAEGVEEEYQKDFLLSKNCVQMQGYLFSKPLSKEEFEKLFI